MICLQNLLPRSYALVPQGIRGRGQPIRFPVVRLETVRAEPCRIAVAMNEHSGSTSSTEKDTTGFIDEKEDLKSEIYSQDMTEAMGEVLTYRHELGMNYNFICPDLIVGSCLQTLEDVDRLRKIGVKTIFCLQQDSDLEYFGVDINSIQKYAESCDDIKHYRAKIRDFDAFDLRMKLPSVVRTLHEAINCNGGITYIHCTAGLGRAPAVALAYMFWLQGYNLREAHELLLSKRPCCPKLEAIKSATADILTGFSRQYVNLMWEGNSCSTVEVSGLDIGWGQRISLKYDEGKGAWTLERELPEGKYEYKYIIDGEWKYNVNEPVTKPNSDGHVNNYVHVHDGDSSMEIMLQREHLMGDDIDLSAEQVRIIKGFLESSTKE